MNFYLAKADDRRRHCSYHSCEQNPKYFHKRAKPGWKRKIKKGTTVGIISFGPLDEVYCRECIDKIYQAFKSVFDSKLWILH